MSSQTEISSITAREILSSRGVPTVEVDVLLSGGALGRASVPSGGLGGEQAASALRDGDPAYYLGQGVLSAVDNVESILAPELNGFDSTNQRLLDATMIGLDGTENKTRLGANAILAVSIAAARASAAALGMPLYRYLGGVNSCLLPTPMITVLNGATPARSHTASAEFLVVPVSAETFSDALRQGVEVFQTLRSILNGKGVRTDSGDGLRSNEEGIELILQAIEKLGLRPGEDIALALDPAGLSRYDAGTGRYAAFDQGAPERDSEAMVRYWIDLVGEYPIVSLEDPMAARDLDGWRALTEQIGGRLQLIGGELFTTATDRLRQGIEQKLGNAVRISLMEAGTVSEVIETAELARRFGYASVFAAEPGETEDTFLADLAVATGTGQIKAGVPFHTESAAKYNQLLRIEEQLAQAAQYLGLEASSYRGDM